MAVETITIAEFHERLKAQGVSRREDLAFRCPACGTVQSARDLIVAGAGRDFDEVERFLAFSCVGRFTAAGPADFKRTRPRAGKHGCDWTLGGLLHLHTLAVVTEDGEHHPRFELATPEEAQALAKARAEA